MLKKLAVLRQGIAKVREQLNDPVVLLGLAAIALKFGVDVLTKNMETMHQQMKELDAAITVQRAELIRLRTAQAYPTEADVVEVMSRYRDPDDEPSHNED